MIVIQQAIYGEVPGVTSGYDILNSSGEKNDFPKRVSGSTDLADRPVGSVLSAPIVRGFCVEDYFLFVKTFPDTAPELRSGRVFSHVLFVPKNDLFRISDPSELFQFHLSGIEKDAEMFPINYHPNNIEVIKDRVDGRVVAATNALVFNEQFVWSGYKGYWEWISLIWKRLPKNTKHEIKIGAAFSPDHTISGGLNLCYIPEDAEALWERRSYRVIGLESSESPKSESTSWLMGDVNKAKRFQVLIDDFALTINSLKELKQLEDYGDVYHNINKDVGLNHLLMLAHFISQVNPHNDSGTKGKSKLFETIVSTIPSTPGNLFTALQYYNWRGFPDSTLSLTRAVGNWLDNNMFQTGTVAEGGSALLKALEAGTQNWWAKTVLMYVDNQLKKRRPSDTQVLWQWMNLEPGLISKHAEWLPDDIENDLLQSMPKVNATVKEPLLKMTKQRNWLILHAQVVTECYSPRKAIELQLQIDTDESYSLAFEVMSKSIDEKVFLSIATSCKDPRLYQIAGNMIVKNSDLLKELDITDEGWQHCWEAAIEQGGDVWLGVSDPKQSLFAILDHILDGSAFSETLLNTISATKHSSIKDYPERASIWELIPTKARSRFIRKTLSDFVAGPSAGEFNFNDLEPVLKKEVNSQEVLQQIIESGDVPILRKLNMFDILSGMQEHHAQKLIHSHQFSPLEADKLGQIISKKGWRTTANTIYSKSFHRRDLRPALERCMRLLNFWQKLSISIGGASPSTITIDEWWRGFSEVSSEIYPHGPEQNGLWERAGGDLSQLQTSGSGREKWSRAIQISRNGGTPTVRSLIRTMREDYSNNEKLKTLENIL